jgi:hypothetical protein
MGATAKTDFAPEPNFSTYSFIYDIFQTNLFKLILADLHSFSTDGMIDRPPLSGPLGLLVH